MTFDHRGNPIYIKKVATEKLPPGMSALDIECPEDAKCEKTGAIYKYQELKRVKAAQRSQRLLSQVQQHGLAL